MRRWVGASWKGLERAGSRLGLGRLRRFPAFERWVYGTLQGGIHRVARSEVAMVQGHRMRLDPGDHLRLSLNGVYEPFATKLVARLTRPGMVAVDVGANIGYFTLLLARAVGPTGHVVAIEPHPDNFALLQENVQANGYANVELIHAAVSREAGTLELHLHEQAGGHSLRRIEGARTVRVPALRLDDQLGEHARVDVLKIDVEGAEGLSLAGMTGILDANPRIAILMEFNREFLDETPVGAEATLGILTQRGFQFHILHDRDDSLELVTTNDLLRRPTENLLCAREGVL